MEENEKSSDEAYSAEHRFVLKLSKDDVAIVRTFLYGEKDNRKWLFDFLNKGNKATIVPQDVMIYIMAYLLKFNSSSDISVEIITLDDTVDENGDPEYYLLVTAKSFNI